MEDATRADMPGKGSGGPPHRSTGGLVVGLFGLAVLGACGGGGAGSQAPPRLTVAVSLQPASLAAIDGGQRASVTATVSGDSGAKGVNWALACPAGITSCGTMAMTNSPSGATNAFQSNAAAGVTQLIKITATSVLDPSKSQSVSVTVNPPPVAAADSLQYAVVGTPFSISITKLVEGGTAPIRCASAGGSLPTGLAFDPASGQVSGVPSSAAPSTTVRYSCTDSASPPITLGTDVAFNIQVLATVTGMPLQMTSARFASTATLLSNGTVLVAGGSTSVGPSDMGSLDMLWYPLADAATASAEVFDPASSAFTSTSLVTMSRFQHTATLLPDGRVLLAGGGNSSLPPLAEVYDPGTRLFTATGTMTSQRRQHTATALKDGRVLLVGGVDENDQPLASAEIYNPVTGHFSATGALNTARTLHAAALLGDGRVLVTGGSALVTSDGGALILGLMPLATAEIFDPAKDRFTQAGTMIAARSSHTATTLPGTTEFPAGFVLLAGGQGKTGSPLASSEIYDPGTGAFATIKSMGFARLRHSATLRSDGTVLLAGGGNELVSTCFHTGPGPPCGGGGPPPTALAPTASIELFNPVTLAFTPYGTLMEARDTHAATLLQNGVLFVAGGEVLKRDYSPSVARLKRGGGGSYIEFLVAVASAEAIP